MAIIGHCPNIILFLARYRLSKVNVFSVSIWIVRTMVNVQWEIEQNQYSTRVSKVD